MEASGVTHFVMDKNGRGLIGVLHFVNYLDNGYKNVKITKVNI